MDPEARRGYGLPEVCWSSCPIRSRTPSMTYLKIGSLVGPSHGIVSALAPLNPDACGRDRYIHMRLVGPSSLKSVLVQVVWVSYAAS